MASVRWKTLISGLKRLWQHTRNFPIQIKRYGNKFSIKYFDSHLLLNPGFLKHYFMWQVKVTWDTVISISYLYICISIYLPTYLWPAPGLRFHQYADLYKALNMKFKTMCRVFVIGIKIQIFCISPSFWSCDVPFIAEATVSPGPRLVQCRSLLIVMGEQAVTGLKMTLSETPISPLLPHKEKRGIPLGGSYFVASKSTSFNARFWGNEVWLLNLATCTLDAISRCWFEFHETPEVTGEFSGYVHILLC